MKKKYFIIIINLLLLSSCQIRKHWRIENYVLEGSGYFRVNKQHVKETKEYFVCGEKINLGIYPQTYIKTNLSTGSYKSKGPYKIRIHFSPGYNNKKKKIIIHNIKITSNIKNEYIFSDKDSFPVEVKPEPFYHAENINKNKNKNKNYKVSYNYLIDKSFIFNYKKNEIIIIELDIEVIKNNIIERDKIKLKLIPVLDKGAKFNLL